MRTCIGLLLIALATGAGCGKRGSPLPPLPRGPLPPGDVSARQIGARTFVGFEVPEARGEKPSQQPVEAELVRVSYAPGLQAPPDPDAFRRRGEVVAATAADPLPSGERVLLEDPTLGALSGKGTGWTLRYAVRVRDRRGRPSPLVVAEDLIVVETQAGPETLRAEPTAEGVRLVWDPPSDAADATYNVYRADAGQDWPKAPLNAEPLAASEFLDNTVVTGGRYRYEVRRVLEAGTPYREGRPAQAVELLAEDLFPPRPPDGLVAVQEGPAVRLFWNPNPERDLAGYAVERRTAGGAWERIVDGLVDRSSHLDRDVLPGQRIEYRIVAVDRAAPPNESRPSSVVELELVAEPSTGGAEP